MSGPLKDQKALAQNTVVTTQSRDINTNTNVYQNQDSGTELIAPIAKKWFYGIFAVFFGLKCINSGRVLSKKNQVVGDTTLFREGLTAELAIS